MHLLLLLLTPLFLGKPTQTRETTLHLPHPKKGKKNELGGAGYRSRYLSHAKRALYHLSYAPCVGEQVLQANLDQNFSVF